MTIQEVINKLEAVADKDLPLLTEEGLEVADIQTELNCVILVIE